MKETCRHGNSLSSSCSFCKFEREKHIDGKSIPGLGRPLSELRCDKCGYTTVYQDALRRHTCTDMEQLTVEETAQKLLDDLSNSRPSGNRLRRAFKKLVSRPGGTWQHQKLTEGSVVVKDADSIRLENAEEYLSLLCAKLEI